MRRIAQTTATPFSHARRGCLACGLAALAGCTRPPPAVVELPPPEVTVATPVTRKVVDHVRFSGNVEAVEAVEIKARVSGFVTEIHFTDGQAVKAGQPLFTIDERPYEIARDEAAAEIAKQEAILAEQRNEVLRKQKLVPKAAVTQEEYEIAVAKRDATAATLAAAKAALARANLNLEFCRVTSPIAGRVSRRFVTIGDLVTGTDSSATTLTAVVSTDPVYVTFDADERSVLLARSRAQQQPDHTSGPPVEWRNIKELGIPVDVELVTESGFPHRGLLDFVDVAVAQGTGTVRCRAVLDNPGRLMMPGMFVRVRLPFGDPYEALLVPDRVIGTDQGRRFVYVIDDNNRVAARPVVPGPLDDADDGLRIISEGLTADDRVVTSGLVRMRPGITVRPVEE